MIEFHKRNLVREFDVVDISARKSTDRIPVGEPVIVTVNAENRTNSEATTAVTLTTEEIEAETTEIHVPPKDSETIELETSFDEAGEYTLKVNERAVGNPVIVTEQKVEADAEDPNSESQGTTEVDQPGFGIIESIVALGGVSYLIKQQLSNE